MQDSQKFLISKRLLLNIEQVVFSDLFGQRRRGAVVQALWKKAFVKIRSHGGPNVAATQEKTREAEKNFLGFFGEKGIDRGF